MKGRSDPVLLLFGGRLKAMDECKFSRLVKVRTSFSPNDLLEAHHPIPIIDIHLNALELARQE